MAGPVNRTKRYGGANESPTIRHYHKKITTPGKCKKTTYPIPNEVTVQLPISLERHRSEQKPREQGTDEDRSGVYFDVNKHRTAVGNAVIEAECRCPYVSERLPPQQALVLKAQTQDTRSQLSTITHRIAEIEATGPDSSVSLERPSTMISNREKRFLKMTAIIDREVTVQGGI